ncbi:MAG TPA: DUF3943 domain-containing protein [Pseudobdellovibrionaceae bacterium]|nr:DUF3943 domain-containing protein [Pseudobdellovibrionaceae bacterium]
MPWKRWYLFFGSHRISIRRALGCIAMLAVISGALSTRAQTLRSDDPGLSYGGIRVTREMLREIVLEQELRDRGLQRPGPYRADAPQMRAVMRGHWIAVDTRDGVACGRIRESIFRMQSARRAEADVTLANMCDHDPARPVVSVLVFDPMDPDTFTREIDLNWLKSTDKNLVTDTRNLTFAMAGMMGLLWMLPESVTNWKKDQIRQNPGGIFDEYRQNLRKGPVWDKDDWYINFVGHPLSGAAYYTLARHNNLTPMQSFGYSVLMSTFFWEYGFEAFAEIPSYQDLIITPVVGSILGEMFFQWEQRIRANNGELMGSKRLGKIAMVALNPMGSLSNWINRGLGSRFIQSARADLIMRSGRRNAPVNLADPFGAPAGNMIGLQLRFEFW